MKVKLYIDDIMSPEEEEKAEEIKEFIDDILGVKPVGSLSEYESYCDEE